MKYTSCFIGIPLPEDFLEQFSKLAKEIKGIFPDIKLADVNSPHLTIYYLDQKSHNAINEISQVVQKSANLIASTKLKIGRMGVFDIQKPRVLYLRVEFGPELVALKDLLNQDLEGYGAIDNSLGFIPHITVGRIPIDSKSEFLRKKGKLEKLMNNVEWSFEVNKLSIFGVDSRIQPEKQKILVDITF